MTPNNILKKLIILTGDTKEDIESACENSGFDFSKSQIHGWLQSDSNRKYRPMTIQELKNVMDSLIAELPANE